MSLKDLEDYLNSGNHESDEELDSETIKNEWLHAVKSLYDQIQDWLRPLENHPKFHIQFRKKLLNEEAIGEYEVSQMTIKIRGKKAVLDPIGAVIIGAKGRIDLTGPNGTVKFILVDKRMTKPNFTVSTCVNPDSVKESQNVSEHYNAPIQLEWKLMVYAPDLRYLTLDKDRFSNALLRVIRNG